MKQLLSRKSGVALFIAIPIWLAPEMMWCVVWAMWDVMNLFIDDIAGTKNETIK